MDENTEKRVKRPRIGENKGEAMENESRYSNYEARGAQGADDQHEAGTGYNQNYSRRNLRLFITKIQKPRTRSHNV